MVAPASILFLGLLSLAYAQQIHRDAFEGNETAWIKGPTDAKVKEIAHRITDEHAHSGQHSEFIHVEADSGSFIYYQYEVGQAPMCDELTVGLWVRGNRPGVQLLARLVLPKEHSTERPDEPLTVMLRGDVYQNTSRWQPLQLRRPMKLLTEQQQLLRAELRRDVDVTGAFIDRLLVNLYPGPGETQVWLDDLEVGPLAKGSLFRTTSRTRNRETGTPDGRPPRQTGMVQIKDGRLVVNGKRFFVRGIRHSGTPLKTLRDAGFNALWIDENTPTEGPDGIEGAINQGFWLIPSLPTLADDDTDAAADSITRTVSRLSAQDAVLLWDLGGGLTMEQAPKTARLAALVRSTDREHPLAADVWDGFRPFSRSVQLLGVHRWPLMTGLELTQYREWLNQRRVLAQSDAFMWTWIQTHLPDWYTNLVYERASGGGFNEPIGPQPEQIKLLAYTAIGAGCRGLGFWSDRFLADSHQGRDRLLALALLNMELQMLEPMLVNADPPTWIDTSEKDVKAAVLRVYERGILVLPMWVGGSAQMVPGQSAKSRLTIVVPQVPESLIPYEISPGEIRQIRDVQHPPGGVKITIPEFGLTTAVAFMPPTGPNSLLVHYQKLTMKMRKLAAQWAYDLAQQELIKVTQINQELVQANHGQPDGDRLLLDARSRLDRCRRYWEDNNFPEAYHEADRALRPLRILMRAEWEDACKLLDTPVASPYALSYYTLPRHWRFMDQVQSARAGGNVMQGGDFEGPNSWQQVESPTLDAAYVDRDARIVPEDPHEGKHCLKLEIKAKTTPGPDGKVPPPPAALERTFLAVYGPTVRLQPGTLVRISVWVRIPKAISASADGALIYDSAGGEPLAVRMAGEVKQWRKVTLYRRVPGTGVINVTLALTGIGKAYFDDVRIEPLESTGTSQNSGVQAIRFSK
jgi:hypothetical protein